MEGQNTKTKEDFIKGLTHPRRVELAEILFGEGEVGVEAREAGYNDLIIQEMARDIRRNVEGFEEFVPGLPVEEKAEEATEEVAEATPEATPAAPEANLSATPVETPAAPEAETVTPAPEAAPETPAQPEAAPEATPDAPEAPKG